MAISNFIPTVWSESLSRQLNREYVGVNNCSREFEGVISDKGSTVKVVSIGSINISNYTKDTNMSAPQTLSDSERTLTINQAKSFNFQIDDVDRAQALPGLMEMAMCEPAAAVADVADSYVFSLHTEALPANTITQNALTADNILDTIIEARQALLTNGVSGSTPVVLEVSPAVAAVLMKAQILKSTDNTTVLTNGAIGNILGFEVYVSANIAIGSDNIYKCFARTKRAIAFAEQINEVEAYRPELRFADAVKGLHLYGAKLIYPNELILLNLKV